MEVIENIHSFGRIQSSTAIALGYFDGIHLGHQKLIATTKMIATEKNIKSAVFTFKTHPLSIISPEEAPQLLYSNRKKIEIIKSLGINYMIYPDFTNDIMNSIPEKFIKDILIDLFNVKSIIVGFNYRFGYKGIGTSDTLMELGKKYGFDVTIIEPVKVRDITISSTKIRSLIQNGEVSLAEKYLGRSYSIIGKVIPGKGLGKKIDIPTANIEIDNKIVLPKRGVYHTLVTHNNTKYNAVTSVGINPTFINHPLSVESNILDFNNDIYNEEIEIHFIERIRKEIKFNSLVDLTTQIKKDIEFARSKFI